MLATPRPGIDRRGGTPSPARGRCSRPLSTASGLGLRGAPAPTASRSRVRWLGESIGYIYVYLRGKLDAGERRRRLLEERSGAETLLAGALNELGQIVLRDGVQHAELTGLLEAIGRAHARREAAAADAATSESLQQNGGDAARRTSRRRRGRMDRRRQAPAASPSRSCAPRPPIAARRARVWRGSRTSARASNATPRRERSRRRRAAAQLAHDAAGLAAEQRALEENAERLDAQLADLRDKAATLRDAAAAAKAKLDQVVAATPAGGVGDGGEHRGTAARSRRRRARDRRPDRAARPRGRRCPPAARDAAVRLPEHRSPDGDASATAAPSSRRSSRRAATTITASCWPASAC